MKTCTNREIGRLLPFYEADALSQEDNVHFEEHLFECEYCLHEIESSSDVSLLLRRHARALRNKFQTEERGFEHEIALLNENPSASDRPAHRSTNAPRSDSRFGSRRLWAGSAAAALFLTLMFLLSTSYDSEAPLSPGLTETRAPSDSSTVILPLPEQTPPARVSDNAPTVGAYDSLSVQNLSDSQVGTRLASDVEALLPRVPIPYLGLITRGNAEPLQDVFEHAMTAYTQGEYVSCIGLMKPYLESHPNDAKALMYLGSAFYMTREFQRSLDAFSRYELLSQGNIDVRVPFYKAACLMQLGQYRDALALLQTLSLAPNKAIAESSAELLRVAKLSIADLRN